MKSGAFTNIIPRSQGEKASGEQWENLILALVEYSLKKLKIFAGTHMKDGGGRLLVEHLSMDQTLTLIFYSQIESHHERIHW